MCSLIVFVFVIVFVAVFLLVRSCLLITMIRCLICHKRPGSLCSGLKFLIVSCARAREIVTYRAVSESDYVWTVKVKSDFLKRTMPKKVQIFFRSFTLVCKNHQFVIIIYIFIIIKTDPPPLTQCPA